MEPRARPLSPSESSPPPKSLGALATHHHPLPAGGRWPLPHLFDGCVQEAQLLARGRLVRDPGVKQAVRARQEAVHPLYAARAPHLLSMRTCARRHGRQGGGAQALWAPAQGARQADTCMRACGFRSTVPTPSKRRKGEGGQGASLQTVHLARPSSLCSGGDGGCRRRRSNNPSPSRPRPSPSPVLPTLVSLSGPMNSSYSRRLSAPNWFTTSSGLITLPRLLLILCARACGAAGAGGARGRGSGCARKGRIRPHAMSRTLARRQHDAS